MCACVCVGVCSRGGREPQVCQDKALEKEELHTDLSTSQDSVVLMKTELGSGTWREANVVSGKAWVGLSPLAAHLCREPGLCAVLRAPSSPAAAHPA